MVYGVRKKREQNLPSALGLNLTNSHCRSEYPGPEGSALVSPLRGVLTEVGDVFLFNTISF
jgi:hypothetical protein